ncbi:MAG: glycosyltransferase, partial [Chloroflexota bacterium]|nr:glycosyltransferase [Chloroflexota bacterium]
MLAAVLAGNASVAIPRPAAPAERAWGPAAVSTPAERYLVAGMSTAQRWIFRCLVAVWGASLLIFWPWWFQEEHVVTWPGMLLSTTLLAWSMCLPAWFFFFVHRMRRPNPRMGLPNGRVAMVVTKAPSEPWPVVRKTLEAMLAQDFPEPREVWLGQLAGRGTSRTRWFDVWLADEDPTDETRRWCAEHGVNISSRRGVAGYNNPTWPGRQKCKEGNLRYFYEVMGGYANYDFVVQLDADHVPSPNYLIEMIRPFADAKVGYVAAPSICDANAGQSWAARGRLHAEASLHGALQAGYNDGFAPLCIGSHYAVRTRALRQAGGLGPELAEDHSTTLVLNAHGWRGVFAPDAIAHGDGPASLADCVTQEFQWSRSLVRLLLGYTGRHWRGLDLRARVEFGFAQVWYPLFALHLLVAYLLPPVALLTRSPWVNVELPAFLLRSSFVTVCCLAPVWWVQRQGWFRPADARVLSWEAMLFQLARWPWVLLGCGHAILGHILGKEFAFRVTPKGNGGAQPLPLSLVLPYLALVVIEAGVAIAVDEPGQARGYYYFALLNAAVYSGVILAIVGLHLRECLRHSSGRMRAWLITVSRSVPVIAVAAQ